MSELTPDELLTQEIYAAMQIDYLSERHDALKAIVRREEAKILDTSTVTRFEVIDHRAVDEHGNVAGRVIVDYDVAVELSFQDAHRTLKVFINNQE
jgi:hypothetical protein